MATRNYRREYDEYQGKPEQKANRAARNRARYQLEKEGRVHKGDGKDVDHKVPLSKGGSTAKSNLAVKTVHANRSYKRNKDRKPA
jgi:hypothetical protein